MAERQTLSARLQTQARLGIMGVPDGHDYVGWRDAANALDAALVALEGVEAEWRERPFGNVWLWEKLQDALDILRGEK